MNILTDDLPKSVEVDGRAWPIRWNHRDCIRAFNAIIEQDDIAEALETFYGDAVPDDIEAAVLAMCRFLSGVPVPEYRSGHGKAGRQAERAYSFVYDQSWIFGAFWSNFGIDLSCQTLHWWVFRALLENVRDCALADIIRIRTAEERGSREEVKEIRRQKNEWQLPRAHRETAEEEAVTQALLNGGEGLSELLGQESGK